MTASTAAIWHPAKGGGRLVAATLSAGARPDGSGVVAAVGYHVRHFKHDDKVYTYSWDNPKGRFHAEYIAVASKVAAPLPVGLDLKHAGAIPTTGLTRCRVSTNSSSFTEHPAVWERWPCSLQSCGS